MSANFDREWPLAELLDSPLLARAGNLLRQLLGDGVAIQDAQGDFLWGSPPASPIREPLVLELEPIGWLLCDTGQAPALPAAAGLLQLLLRAQARFHMAADLHVEPIADDLASLTLDLLLAQDGLQRHGSNLLLLFGDPDEEPAAPDPAGAAAR